MSIPLGPVQGSAHLATPDAAGRQADAALGDVQQGGYAMWSRTVCDGKPSVRLLPTVQ